MSTAVPRQAAGDSDPRQKSLPRWAQIRATTANKPPPPSFWAAAATIVSSATFCMAAVTFATEGFILASWIAIALAAILSLTYLVRAWRAEQQSRLAVAQRQRQYQDVYDRAGISIWREDWSTVGQRILELRHAGVDDVPGWFAARPDEARALHASVLITDVNRTSVEIMGARDKSALTGSLARVLPGSAFTFGRWLAALTAGEDVYAAESRITRLDGTPLDCFVTAALPTDLDGFRDIVVSVIDIGSYKQDQARLAEAEAEIARAQRIATVGALTASIAHEVNSPLAAIASNAAACIRWLDRNEPEIAEAQDAARAVLVEAERARGVIDGTRRFLSRSPRRATKVQIASLIAEAVRMTEREAQLHAVGLCVQVEEDLPPVMVDTLQVQQILMNLMMNGIQAMDQASHPRALNISAERRDSHVLISVADSGRGLQAQELDQIFEPFYSSRDGGMGMGLAISRSCCEAQGGQLWVESVPEAGSTFYFTLPIAPPEAA